MEMRRNECPTLILTVINVYLSCPRLKLTLFSLKFGKNCFKFAENKYTWYRSCGQLAIANVCVNVKLVNSLPCCLRHFLKYLNVFNFFLDLEAPYRKVTFV